MPALSTSTISASDGASKLAAKPGTRGADKSTDGSPFAAVLAATSQQSEPRKPQAVATPAANNNDTPIAKSTEPQTQTVPAGPRTQGDNIVSKDSGKRDKKADSDTDPDDDTVAAAPPPPAMQTAAVQINIPAVVQASVPVAVPPDAQINPQAPGTSGTGSSLAAIDAASSSAAGSGAPAAQIGNANNVPGNRPVNAVPADPQSASQPVPVPVAVNGQNGPAAQSPAPTQQIAATDDDDVAATDAPPSVSAVAKNDKPVAQNKAGDSKAAADKAADIKAAGKSPVDPQTLSQPTADDDAEPAAQTVAAAPPVGSAPIAPNGSAGAVTAAQLADAAPPAQAAKSDTKGSGPANKPTQTAANINAPSPAINTPPPATPAAAVPGKADANGTDSGQTAASNNTDGKPAHVSASDATPQQPAAPAPIPQAAPAPVMPQGMATAAFGAAAPAAGTGGTVTTAVHIVAADADPTLTLGALAVSVAARSLSGARQFDIRLDPPELGRVDVRLSIDASGKTEAHMTADQPQTLSLLQKDAPTLTQALRDAGLDVSQSGLNFSLRGQDRQNGSGGNDAGQGRRTNLTATRAIQAAQSPTAISFNGAAVDARVDIHV